MLSDLSIPFIQEKIFPGIENSKEINNINKNLSSLHLLNSSDTHNEYLILSEFEKSIFCINDFSKYISSDIINPFSKHRIFT